MVLLISAFRHLRGELKDEMRASEDRVNKRIGEVKDEMKDFKEQVRDNYALTRRGSTSALMR